MDFKKKRGITLIVIIVTIIALLLLAGISIILLVRQNGVIERAEEVQEGSEQEAEEEVLEGSVKEDDDEDVDEDENENGKQQTTIITEGNTKLKIGDYVAYDPTAGATRTSVTSKKEDTGHSEDQVFKLSSLDKKSGARWQVLGKDEKTGEILLILAGVLEPTTGGMTEGQATYYVLEGQEGYKNGINELNKICSLYGQGKYATGARSVTVEDINKITGYDPTEEKDNQGFLHDYGNEVTYTKNGNTIKYKGANKQSGTYNTETFIYFDESTKKWKELGEGESVTQTSSAYGYEISSWTGIDEVSKKVISAEAGYWLGTSVVVPISGEYEEECGVEYGLLYAYLMGVCADLWLYDTHGWAECRL